MTAWEATGYVLWGMTCAAIAAFRAGRWWERRALLRAAIAAQKRSAEFFGELMRATQKAIVEWKNGVAWLTHPPGMRCGASGEHPATECTAVKMIPGPFIDCDCKAHFEAIDNDDKPLQGDPLPAPPVAPPTLRQRVAGWFR